MSDPLWKYEDYVRFTQHPNAEVRLWALERLKKYGAQAKAPIAALIEDEDPQVRTEATRMLGEIGSGEDGPRLLQLFQKSVGLPAGHYALALGRLRYAPAVPALLERLSLQPDLPERGYLLEALGRIGGEQVRAALRSLVQEIRKNDWEAATLVRELLNVGEATEIPLVVAQYFKLAPEEKDNYILAEFRQVTLTAGLAEHFRIECNGELEAMLEAAEDWDLEVAGKLSPAFEEALQGRSSGQDYESTVELIRQEALCLGLQRGFHVAEPDRIPLGALPSYQRLDWMRLLFINAFGDAAATLSWRQRRRRRKVAAQEVEFLLAALLSLADTPDYEALLAASKDRTATLLEIVTSDREEVPQEFIAELQALGPSVVPAMQKVLEEDPDSWGAYRAARILGEIAEAQPEACIPAIPALMKGLQDEVGDMVCEECQKALQRIGEPVLEEAARVLAEGDETQKLYLLGVLEEIPVERSVDLILEHYEELLEVWPEPTVEALKSLGSARAMEKLRPDALLGESLYEDAFLLLCDLHGIQMKELDTLRARHGKRQERLARNLETIQSASGMEEALARLSEEPLHLQLKCRACGRTYTYEVERVIYCQEAADRQDQAYFVQDKILCKNCGAEDQYEFTDKAHLALTAELLSMVIQAKKKGRKPPATSRLLIVDSVVLADGTHCTPAEAMAIYRQRIAQAPDNPEYRFRFGNVLRSMGRIEEAQEQYEEAIRLDPTCAEAHLNLGIMAYERGHRGKMERHLKQVLAHAPHSGHPQWREWVSLARDLLAGKELEIEMGPFPTPLPRQPEPAASIRRQPPAQAAPATPPSKVGRNDPCPCGSGKKYKRCCGR